MGMGYGANFAEVVEDAKLAKLLPKEHSALTLAMSMVEAGDEENFPQTNLAGVAQAIEMDEKIDQGVDKALIAIQKAFAEKYDGLELLLGFHDQEEQGDRYDDVSGAYWHVDGLYVLSPGAKKLGKGIFERKFFVHFA